MIQRKVNLKIINKKKKKIKIIRKKKKKREFAILSSLLIMYCIGQLVKIVYNISNFLNDECVNIYVTWYLII